LIIKKLESIKTVSVLKENQNSIPMKPRIYIDTSVIGGCVDEEFSVWSNRLIKAFQLGLKIPMISNLTREEISFAPLEVRNVLSKLDDMEVENIFIHEEAELLAKEYIRSGVLFQKDAMDARHIALASVERADVLVSWNFKHIVNLHRIHGYNSVNLKWGCPLLEIRSPREVLDEKEI
jgi:hypothetical protein